ncbi:hypothetical protein JTE90_016650 [Oedothorax gibbosus]|uniref:Uncharacterized protein n=1 Tax=Oedothorax gibbosus TaxID=931172 RepID=A0AAV6V5F2_9ARAC|nr:hypothetical protein JTE90_016650 [Oedothorax gibbosus]
MEYPQRKKPFFKRPRKLPLSHRYPKTFYFSIVGVSLLVFFSKPIYDTIYHPPTVDYFALEPEERRRLVDEQRRKGGFIVPLRTD